MLHERLRRARVLKNLTLQQVADQIGDISKQALSKYEKGIDSPNSERLIRLADVFGVTPEYFFRSDSVRLGEVDFRKHSAFGVRQQEAVKEQVQEHLERYLAAERLLNLDESASDFTQWRNAFSVSSSEEVECVADEVRDAWDLGSNPIGNLTEVLEEHGVKVVGLDGHEKFDGLCAEINDGRDAVIVSNTNRPGERQRFNLAHELGHLVMHMPEEIHGTKDEENWCHRFSGALIFPADQVRETFGEVRKKVLLEEFLLAKEEWGISIQAILRRLYDLGIVQHSFYQATSREWSGRGFRKAEPNALPDDYEKSYRLRQLVYRALAEGVVTPSRSAELLGTDLSEVESLMANGHAEEGQDARERPSI